MKYNVNQQIILKGWQQRRQVDHGYLYLKIIYLLVVIPAVAECRYMVFFEN